MLQIRTRLQDAIHLFARENLGQLRGQLATRDAKRRVRLLERDMKQKGQRTSRLVRARPRELALLDQMQQITLNLVFAQLLWRATVVLGNADHGRDVGLSRPVSQTAQHHVVVHLLA